MNTKTYARIECGRVAEFLATAGDIVAMFHRDLEWVEVTDVAGIAYRWTYDGQHFAPPPPAEGESLPGKSNVTGAG
jgi:DNA-binding XRE family transcriptional regulator